MNKQSLIIGPGFASYEPKTPTSTSRIFVRHYPQILTVFVLLGILLTPGLAGAQAAVAWDAVVGVFSEDGKWRLDIGERAMKENVPASHNSWATRLIIKRLDGPSTGPVLPDHIVGIFSEDGKWRLDIGERAMKENVPASHNSWATRLRIVRLTGLSLGPVTYGDVVGIFSEDGKWRLDIGERATKENVPASHNSWATRLKIRPLTQ